MKKKIRCNFIDFWQGFDFKKHLGYLLSEYEIIIDEEHPDYLFYSSFGKRHLLYDNCIKIYWSVENVIPNLNICDYAVCLSDIQCGDRIFRHYSSLYFHGRNAFQNTLKPEELLNRKFCNFVYSNSKCSDTFRERFFYALSRYKQVDSGGRYLNNIGGSIQNKLQFIREYKFTLAIENSSLRGYTTEKIYDPFLAQSLPLYWGNPNISSDYHPNSFVNLMSYSSIEEAIEEIIRLDNDNDAYLDKVTTPFWPDGESFESFYDIEIEKLMSFFRHIFDQLPEDAFRRTNYGLVKSFCDREKEVYFPSVLRSLKSIVKKSLNYY